MPGFDACGADLGAGGSLSSWGSAVCAGCCALSVAMVGYPGVRLTRLVGAGAPAGASNHHWAVQLGSFASRANAEKLVRQRKPLDASLYVSSSGKGASLRYRVRIGPLADRDAAERVMAKLKKEGQSASLVAP